MARLGEILVAMGATTPELVRAALQNQVLFGGRLGTNLLELGAVDELALAEALSRRHGCPASAGDRPLDPAALALLGPERVDRLEAVPARLDGRRLEVLVADPTDLAKLDELAFATGKLVRAVVVPEARLWALMQQHYGLVRQLRGLAFDGGPARPAPPPAAAAPAAPPAPGDLMGEDDFAALYERPDAARRPLSPRAAPPPAAPAMPEPGPDELPLPGVPVPHEELPLPGVPVEPPRPARATGWSGIVTNEEVLAALQREASASRAPARAAAPIALAPAVEAEPPPLAFADAVAALAGVADRNAIARTVLRFARSRFRRTILLAIHGDLAEGWDGVGEGLSQQTVARVRVRVSKPGVVHTVVGSRAHFLGPLQRTEENIALLRALGRGAPKTSFAMPVLARGRVVNVLYADGGRGAMVDPAGVGELLILATKIAQSYEALLARAT